MSHIDHHTTPATVRRYHFARLLGQEVAAQPATRPGSWAHMEALQAAWDRAERRSRGGL